MDDRAARQLDAKRQRRGAPPAIPPYRRKPLFEALEQRLLLSADPLAAAYVSPPPDSDSTISAEPFSYSMAAAGANDLALILREAAAGPSLQLIDRVSAAVLAEQALAQTSEVIVMGSWLDDRFEIDASLLDAGIPISFDGGAGSDTLFGPATDTTWTITGEGAGAVGDAQFAGVEYLQGASNNEDTFVFEAAGTLEGTVEGGAAGFDTLIVSAPYMAATFDYTGPTSGSIALDGKVIAYSGMEPITVSSTGGAPPTTVTINIPGTSSDQFSLKDDGTLGNGKLLLDSTNGTFEDTTFDRPTGALTINSGAGDDVITVEILGADAPGSLTIDGGSNSDAIAVARDVSSFTLSDASLTAGAETITLINVEAANLTGGLSANAFTVTGWSGSGTLDGAGGTDTVVAVNNVNFTLSDSSLARTELGALTLSAIETANLTGGVGDTTFTLSGWTQGGTLTGGSGSDTVIAAKNANFTLANASLAASDGMNVTLSSIETANLTGGAGDNTFTVGDTWSGTANLAGLAGNDRYVLKNNWGTVNVTEAAGGGTDILDFSQVTGALTVSEDQTTIKSGGSTLTQTDPELIEEIDVTLASGFTGASGKLKDWFDDLADFIEQLQAATGGLAELISQIPLLNQTGASIAQLASLTDAFADLRDEANAKIDALGSAPKLSEVVAALNLIAPAVLNSVVFSTSYRGRPPATNGPSVDDYLEILIDIDLEDSVSETIDLTFGAEAESLGIDIDAEFSVDVDLTGHLTIGLTTEGPQSVFVIPGGTLTLAVDANASLTGSTINVGLLELEITSGSADVAGGLILELTDPDNTDLLNRITLTELTTEPSSSLVNVTEDADPATAGIQPQTFTVDTTVSVAPGVLVGGADLSLATVTFSADISGGIFDALTPAIVLDADTGTGIIDLLDFGNVTPTEALGMLRQVFDMLTAMAANEALNTEIPFSDGKTLGGALDFAAAFKVKVLDPLFVSGNLLDPDNDDDGDVDFDDLQFSSIQGLVARLTEVLEPGSALKAAYDPSSGELTFDIDFSHALDFGLAELDFGASLGELAQIETDGSFSMSANLTTGLTFGIDLDPSQTLEIAPAVHSTAASVSVERPAGAVDNHVQIIALKNATDGKFNLNFLGDASGDLDFNASAATVEAALQGLDGISDVTVGLTVIGIERYYTVTFTTPSAPAGLLVAASAAGDPLVGPADNGQLSADAHFGLKLFYDPVVPVVTTVEGDASTDEQQSVTVLNATGGTFELSFNGTATAPIAYNALATGTGSVEAALVALDGIAVGDVGVTKSGSTYTITFLGALAKSNVAQLTANPSALVNATPFVDIANITVDDTATSGNASLDDLRADVQAAVDQALIDAGKTLGFLDVELAAGVLFDAGKPALTTLATDLSFTIPARAVVATITAGADPSTDEVQRVTLHQATGGTFTLSFGGTPTGPLAYNAAAGAVEAALEAAGIADVSVTRSDDATRLETAYEITFLDPGDSNVAELVADDSALKGIAGRVTKAAADSVGIAQALENALAGALTGKGISAISVDVTTDAGSQINLEATGGSLGLQIASAVKAEAGGGKVSLSARPAGVSVNELARATAVGGRLEVNTEYGDAAFQQLGLASAPTRYDGVTTDQIKFTLFVNGTALPEVTVAAQPGNLSIDDLVADIQAVVNTALTTAFGDSDQDDDGTPDVEVFRVAQQVGQISIVGNRIGLRGDPDFVTKLSINVPLDRDPGTGGIQLNGAVSELGFTPGTGETKRAKALEFFLEDVALDGSISLATPDPVTLTAALGFLGITAKGQGTLEDNKFFEADLDVDVVNPVDGDSRVSIAVLAAALSDGKFFYDGTPSGTEEHPGTGFISGTLAGGVGLSLDVSPDGVLSGISGLDAFVEISSASEDWFVAPAPFGDPLGIGFDVIGLGTTPTVLGAAAPSNGVLDEDVSFTISDGTNEAIVVLLADDTSGFTSRSALATALNTAISDALTDAGVTGSVTLSIDNGTGEISLATSDSDRTMRRPIAFSGPDVGDILDRFRDLSFDDIIDGLQLLIGFLRELDGSAPAGDGEEGGGGGGAVAGAIDYKLPLIDRSIADLVDIAGALAERIDAIAADPAGGVQALEALLRNVFDLPAIGDPLGMGFGGLSFALDSPFTFDNDAPADGKLDEDLSFKISKSGAEPEESVVTVKAADTANNSSSDDLKDQLQAALNLVLVSWGLSENDVTVGWDGNKIMLTNSGGVSGLSLSPFSVLSFDPIDGVLEFDFTFGAGTHLSRPFNLDLADAGLPDVFTNLVSLSATGNLAVAADVSFDLLMGLDLSGEDKAFYIDTAGTKLSASARASGEDLSFRGQLGPFGLFVEDGSASLAADIDISLIDANGNGRLVLVGFGGSVVDSDLDELGSFVGTSSITFGANASASLPLYIGTEDLMVPMGDPNVLAVTFDVDELFATGDADPDGDENDISFPSIPSFSFEDLAANLPGIFALLSDPAMVIDGLDRVLQTLQDALSGQIFGIELPFVGDLLADNPATHVIEDFRDELLKPLANTIRENNLDLEGLVGLIQQTIFDALNPLGLLRDANADSLYTPDDVVFRYLDSEGEETDAFSATAIQIDFDIGKTFIFTAPEISFDVGIPVLGIEADFTPRVTIDFNLHVGFGLDQSIGFYFVSNYDNPNTAAEQDDELSVSATIDFTTDAEDPASAQGRLLFLALNLTDGIDLDGDGLDVSVGFDTSENEDFTKLFIQGGIDAIEPLAGRNEVQSVTVNATGGTFRLKFQDDTSANIAYNATAAAVKAALVALDGIEEGDVAVTKSGNIYKIAFQGDLANQNVAALTALSKGTGFGLTRGTADGTATVKTVKQGRLEQPEGDGRLSIPELLSASISEILEPGLIGGAVLRAHAEVDFSTLGDEFGNVLPSIATDIVVDFVIEATPQTGLVVNSPDVAFLDVTVDLGSFISKFAGPLLESIGDILDPLGFLIGPDGFLNARVPLLSDLLGGNITGKDLIVMFDPTHGPQVVAFLDFVDQLYFLLDLITDAAEESSGGDSVLLNFGDLVLMDGPAGLDLSLGAGVVDVLVPTTLPAGTTDLRNVRNLKNASANPSGSQPAESKPAGSKTKSFKSGVTQPGSIDFPLISDPSNIFKLLMGQTATLVTVELPEFGFSFFYRQEIPIYGPIVGIFGGGVSGSIDMGFGYDTLGLQRFLASDNPITLLDGFFLSDIDFETGFDRPEAVLSAQISVGAGLSLGLAKVGVEGGIEATILFNLSDLDDDGKVRINEMIANTVANDYNPLAIFDISGVVEFFLRAFLEINLLLTKITYEYEFIRLKLFDFDIPFERPSILANQAGDTLTLNVGSNAANRLKGNIEDVSEDIHVESYNGGVVVWSEQFNVSQGVARLFPFYGVSRIVADGGVGNDVIDLSDVGSGVVAEIRGGDGNDVLIGGAGADALYGDAGDDMLIGNGGPDSVDGGLGADRLFGDDLPGSSSFTGVPPVLPASVGSFVLNGSAGADTLRAGDGNDYLYGGGGDDSLVGGKGDDSYQKSAGFDEFDLADSGSVEIIDGSTGGGVLDFSDKAENLTFFLLDPAGPDGLQIQVGFGAVTGGGDEIGDFANQVIVKNVVGITDIIGSDHVDTFHVYETAAAGITLDGNKGSDKYIFYVGTPVINATVDDTGNPWDSGDVIEVLGTGNADDITLTNSNITLGGTQSVTYVPPAADANVLQIKIKGLGGDDEVTVESTAETVPVRVEGGDGDDLVTVGGSAVVNNIVAMLRPGLNAPIGLGPLVVVGGEGHDTIMIDDSGETGSDTGYLTAFLEDRTGFPGVEVGVVSGLGMTLLSTDGIEVATTQDGSADPVLNEIQTVAIDGTVVENFRLEFGGQWSAPIELGATDVGALVEAALEGLSGITNVQVVKSVDGGVTTFTITFLNPASTDVAQVNVAAVVNGRAEFEGFEVVDVRMGGGDDTFRVGGDTILSELPPNRVAEGNIDASSVVSTIEGMTIVEGGDGKDDIRVLRTQDLPDQQLEQSTIVTAAQVHQGNRATPRAEEVRLDIRADVGYFVLEFADPTGDGTGTVPGAEQTVVLPYTVTAEQLKDALASLRLVGGNTFIDDVSPTAGTLDPGVVRSYTITFSPQLDDLPALRAFDTKLLVVGGGNDDVISVQSIDQPTYVLGGNVLGTDTPEFDDNDQDVLNVNVQIGINGAELASAPDGLNQIPPAKAVVNGVNAELTVDGGPEGDAYFVYLFGGDADSQINLFDSGGTTDDAAYVFGTEQSDMFLLRAAVANDGLAFVAMIKPAVVPVIEAETTHVERVNYRGSLDSMKIFALEGDDAFGIDDTRLDIEIYGGEGEEFFQIGQLYKSQRSAAAGVPFADVFATIETTRGYLSNGISNAMKIFGGEDNDEFVVYHNLAPLALYGNDGDDSFLIRAFALVGSQEDLRERTDVSGDAGADLIQYAVNAPVNIDGGDGFDTIIVIGTEFNDDFVVTENGIYGAGLNIQFVRVETVEVDGDAGDDRFFILGTSAGILTKITGGLGSDTFFANGPTPDVVSNDLLGHSGLISHSVDSEVDAYSGIKVVGISANVADDDEPAVRITISDGSSVVSQVDPLATDHYTVVLTRKPENGTRVVVTSRAPAGVKFTGDSDGVLGTGGDSIALTFDESNWFTPQTAYFTAYQTGSAEIKVGNDGGNGENARQTLVLQGTEGSFKLHSEDTDLGGTWTTELISFDIRGDGKTADGDDADTLNREEELDRLALDIKTAIEAVSSKDVTVTRVRTTFFLEFEGTEAVAIDALALTDVVLTFNDIVGTGEGFITHDVTLEKGAPSDSVNNLFVQGKVAPQRDGTASVIVDTEGGGVENEVQRLQFDASDGNFKIRLGEQVSEEMLFIPLDPEKVRLSIANAIDAFDGIDAIVTKIGAAGDYSYRIEFVGASAGFDVDTLQVETSNLSKGERTLAIVGGLPPFVTAQGDDALRGATVKVVAGAGIGQTRLIIANTANSITVANPWIAALEETSRIEILRYEGVVLPATLVQIVGDDGNAIDLRETGGGTVAFEAHQVHGFGDGSVIAAGATDTDGLRLVDTVTVALTKPPTGDVTVELSADDAFEHPQLFFAVEGPAGTFTVVESLTFTAGDYDQAQTVYVFGHDDAFTEGFHKALLTLSANGGGYADVVNSLVVDIADDEVALAMVLESNGSTDVVETGNSFNGGGVPGDDVDGDNSASDSYQIVLSKPLQSGETVTVNLSADPTRTQRGAGLLGIRAFDPEVVLSASTSASTLTFTGDDWFTPQTVTVTAAADDKVEGDDSKSFAKMFDQANSIEGPLVITGGLSEDRSADLEREPIYLPGETNFKPSIGTVQAVPTGADGSFSLTIDLDEVIAGETVLDTRIEGGTQGVLTVTTNTNGDADEGIQEVQLLTVDAVSGTFELSFDGTTFTDPINYDPASPATVAAEIQSKLNALTGPDVTVTDAGTAFIITFDLPGNEQPIQFGDNNLVRVGTDVNDDDLAEQILTIYGNGGSFTLSINGGLAKTASIDFSPDDPTVNQAQLIETALNNLLGVASVDVSGSGSTYIVKLAVSPSAALEVFDESLQVDEVQTLTLNASLGSFRLSLDGGATVTTGDALTPGLSAAQLKAAIETLGVTVTVTKDSDRPFYTIIFTGPGGANVNQLEVVESTLERTVKEALETQLDTAITAPGDFQGYTLEITRGEAKNKFRVIIGGSDPEGDSPDSGLTTLIISRPWEGGLTEEVPSLAGFSEYTIEKTNPNLLVDENEETDFFFLNDTDNVTSIGELPTAELIVTADHLSGLGMGGEQLIGGRLLVPGGIQYTGLEELIINLGSGDNRIIIHDTQRGATTINAGEGSDVFFVENVSGHTFLNGQADADTVNVSNAGLLSGINALLTVTGDVPRAVALTLGKGSKPDPVANVGGVDEIQQITVDATGGTFRAGFIVDGERYFTDPLAYDVTAEELQAALQEVVEEAFGVDDTDPDVLVTRGGNVYRVTFTDQMGKQDVPLIDINDLGLTSETGAASGDVLNIDNSADSADTQAVLTPTWLAGLGMGDLGTPGTTFNEIQTLRIDATGGTFTLGIDGTDIESDPLDHDISAVDLDAVLESMYFEYLDGPTANAAGGLVEVARNDDVYVIRFVGLLSNLNVAQLTVDGSELTRADELPGGAVTPMQGLAESATRLDGITSQNQNEVQRLTITATGGIFTLGFPDGDPDNVTEDLPNDVTRAQLQLALEALPAIAPGDVVVSQFEGGFDIEFAGQLSSTDVNELVVASGLTGGTASVETTQVGRDTGLNDVQVLTVNATAGTFRIELFLPAVQKTLLTESLGFDASAEQVRRALQHELARELNGLNDDADLSRTREAFKSDFSVMRTGNTYLIGFQGVTREIDGGEGVSLLKILGDEDFNVSGDADVLTRMDGISYYGFEEVNIGFGSGDDILNVQGTSAGSFKLDLDTVHAATNIALGDGDDRIFISSNADLNAHTDRMTAGQADVFEFLTGTLDDIRGNLNIDVGEGRHRLLVSDEAAAAGDADVTISDSIVTPTGTGLFDDMSAAEIQVRGLSFGDVTYGADLTHGNFYDGIIYWTGSGEDTIDIDGTHVRAGERTTTLLNTGLGGDYVTVDLDDGRSGTDLDGFFVLHTMGGAAAHTPVDPGLAGSGDNDTVRAAESTLPLIVFGGLGNDDIIAGQNEDVVFGDFGRVQYLDAEGGLAAVFGFGGRDDLISSQIIDPARVISRDLNLGDDDIIEGQDDDDVLIGGAGGDYIDGDAGDDLIFGDAVQLHRRNTGVDVLGDISNPRFRALEGDHIYGRTDIDGGSGDVSGVALINGAARDYRNQDGLEPAAWNEYEIVELYHSQSIFDAEKDGFEDGTVASFGDDYIAGGAAHDVIFGQLGDDIVQGDGSIEAAVGPESVGVNRAANPQHELAPVGARRIEGGTLDLTPTLLDLGRYTLDITASFESASDGDDYIEGNGGADVIFGNLGQDDIVGDNSSLFSLDTRNERLPAGADIIFGGSGERIDRNHELGGGNADTIVLDQRHARDADAIAGDNANIYRLVGTGGVDGAAFLEYNYDQSEYEARGMLRLIPRAVELLDYTPGGSDFDSASAAFDIGAADEIHAESGDDFAYGMVGNDVLFGDSEDDDLIGGWGADWISGGTGSDGILGDDGRIFTSRNSIAGEPLYGVAAFADGEMGTTISTPGKMQQSTINVEGALKKTVDLTPFNLTDKGSTDDVYDAPEHANDILFGGLGDDSMHGGAGDDAMSGAEALLGYFAAPVNPGDVLGFGNYSREGMFRDYVEADALAKLEPYFLDFEAHDADGAAVADGNDALFGDLGNDWIVGGTGRDHLYGGFGNDLLDADDDKDTIGGNESPDGPEASYEDIAFGGAGRDVLIANTGGDRLIDWNGEYNTYLVPFAPFGAATVSRALQPQLPEYLYALSTSDGADPTRHEDPGGDAARHGEPWGELGLVLQKDPHWGDQMGAPVDPQAGNVGGGKRDVLRNADASTGGANLAAAGGNTISLTYAGTDSSTLVSFSGSTLPQAPFSDQWLFEDGGERESKRMTRAAAPAPTVDWEQSHRGLGMPFTPLWASAKGAGGASAKLSSFDFLTLAR